MRLAVFRMPLHTEPSYALHMQATLHFAQLDLEAVAVITVRSTRGWTVLL